VVPRGALLLEPRRTLHAVHAPHAEGFATFSFVRSPAAMS
jgi:hypothetical protein